MQNGDHLNVSWDLLEVEKANLPALVHFANDAVGLFHSIFFQR